jgi:hypothetical protein
MSEHHGSEFVGTALLVSNEQQACDVISHSLRSLAIRTEICVDALSAVDLLEKQKFEAIVVDFQLGEQAQGFCEYLQFSRTNRTAVTFAITPDSGLEVKSHSTFVLYRPLIESSVSQTMKAAYGIVIRERRRYFRCPIVVPASVRADDTTKVRCEIVNVSEGGVAIRFRTNPLPAVKAIQFTLPGCTCDFSVGARICWQYPSGVMGLEFKGFSIRQKAELQEWLARKLEQTLPATVVEALRSSGYLLT